MSSTTLALTIETPQLGASSSWEMFESLAVRCRVSCPCAMPRSAADRLRSRRHRRRTHRRRPARRNPSATRSACHAGNPDTADTEVR